MTRFLIGACLTAAIMGTFNFGAADTFETKRCMNMGNALDAPKEGEWGHVIQEDSFRNVKEAGFDTVRIPVRWSAHTGGAPDYKIDERFFARVDEVLGQALSQDLNVILNIHHFEDLNESPEENFPKFIALWSQIAPRYADLPERVYFEVLNEPNGNLQGDIMRKILTAGFHKIRETNPTRILILGGEEWSGINSLPSIPNINDKNQVYTFHYYDPFKFTHQKAGWTDLKNSGVVRWGSRQDKQELKAAADYAKKAQADLGIPLFLGEIGAYEQAPYEDVVAYTGATRKAFEEAGISWCVWNFTATFPFYDSETGAWDLQKLGALGLAPTADTPKKTVNSPEKAVTSESQSLDQIYIDMQRNLGRNAILMVSPYPDELEHYGPASFTQVDDSGVPDGKALEITSNKGANPWDSALSGALWTPVKKGDMILMSYWAKSVKGAGEIASVGIQLAGEPYTGLNTRREILSADWQPYHISVKADRDYKAEELGYTMQVAGAAQTLRVGPILIMNLGQNIPDSRLPN